MRLLGLLLAVIAVPAFASPALDDRGRPIGAPAQRIVTLAPHLAELVHAAGAGDRLVGTVAYSDFPESVVALPRVGDAFRVDLERLSVLRPDVVLAWLGGNPASAIEEIERLGIRVVALHAARLEDIARHLRLIGVLTGREEPADSAASEFEARLTFLEERYSGRRVVSVFYQIAERPLYTVGADHSLNHAIKLCGGRNVFEGLEVLAPSITIEAVLGALPEVIVGGVYPYPAEDPGVLGAWSRWTRIPAVRDGHLYQLDASLMGRPTPRLLDGVETLCDRINRAR